MRHNQDSSKRDSIFDELTTSDEPPLRDIDTGQLVHLRDAINLYYRSSVPVDLFVQMQDVFRKREPGG